MNSRRWHRNHLGYLVHPTYWWAQDPGNHLWFFSLNLHIIKTYPFHLNKMVQIWPPLTIPTATIIVQNTFIFSLDKYFTLFTLFLPTGNILPTACIFLSNMNLVAIILSLKHFSDSNPAGMKSNHFSWLIGSHVFCPCLFHIPLLCEPNSSYSLPLEQIKVIPVSALLHMLNPLLGTLSLPLFQDGCYCFFNIYFLDVTL